jgi:hypothetical protein
MCRHLTTQIDGLVAHGGRRERHVHELHLPGVDLGPIHGHVPRGLDAQADAVATVIRTVSLMTMASFGLRERTSMATPP